MIAVCSQREVYPSRAGALGFIELAQQLADIAL